MPCRARQGLRSVKLSLKRLALKPCFPLSWAKSGYLDGNYCHLTYWIVGNKETEIKRNCSGVPRHRAHLRRHLVIVLEYSIRFPWQDQAPD
jgi:hypothetical protein